MDNESLLDKNLINVLNKINTRLNTYYGMDDCPGGPQYHNGATSELIILKDYIKSMLDKINKQNPPSL